MKKIKVSDLKKVAKGTEILEELGIEVQQYVPVMTKKAMMEYVKNFSIVENEGGYMVDNVWREVFETLSIAKVYANLDFSRIDKIEDESERIEAMIELYDLIVSTGFDNYIYDKSYDSTLFSLKLYNYLDAYVESLNSVGSVISRFIGKIPELGDMENVFKTINEIDDSKLDFIKKVVMKNSGE